MPIRRVARPIGARTTPRRCTATSYDARISTRPLFWAVLKRACVAWRITTIGPIRLSAPFCSIPAPTCLFMAWASALLSKSPMRSRRALPWKISRSSTARLTRPDRSKAWKTPSSCPRSRRSRPTNSNMRAASMCSGKTPTPIAESVWWRNTRTMCSWCRTRRKSRFPPRSSMRCTPCRMHATITPITKLRAVCRQLKK